MATATRVFDFDRAILRTPGRSVTQGLREHDGPSPTYEGVALEHRDYRQALESSGVSVDLLPPLEDYPDSMFVEDPALVFPEGAIMLRPGAATRAGEADHLRPTLLRHFDAVMELPRGHADGGDVLVTPDVVFVGLSSRTDRPGAAALAEALHAIGRRAHIVAPPPGVLHLKTGASLIDEETMLVTAQVEAAGLFGRFRQLVVPLGEEAAANALRVNETLLVGSRFPRTIELLDRLDYSLLPLDTLQAGMIDAGLSCMSLRWSARGSKY
jgi:dimethylargininase